MSRPQLGRVKGRVPESSEGHSRPSLVVAAVAGWEPEQPRVASPCAWAPSQHGGCIPRASVSNERARWKPKPFQNLALEAAQRHFCRILFVRRESLNPPHVRGKRNEIPF